MKRNDDNRNTLRTLLSINPQGITTATLADKMCLSTQRIGQLLREMPHVTKRAGFSAYHTAPEHEAAMLDRLASLSGGQLAEATRTRKWSKTEWTPPPRLVPSVWDLGRI